MPGLKQHHIPQFLLRGFGRARGGKNVQVVAYTRTRGTYRTATQGIGAQRAFYSRPAGAAQAETLDDRITAHEQQLAVFIEGLRGSSHGAAVKAREAAEAVAHLSIRAAHMRDAFASSMADLLGGVEEFVLDPPAMAKYLKLQEPTPSKIVRDTLRQSWTEHRAEFRRLGFSQDAFERFALQRIRADFEGAVGEHAPLMAALMQGLRSRAGEAARKGHVEALAKTLAPAPRVEALARLAWRVEAGSASGFVLPDCVATAFMEDDGCLPLVFADEQRIRAVAMPLAHDRLLLGVHEGQPGPAQDSLAPAFAEASWDYFVARDDDPELAALVPRIGVRVRAFLAEAVEAGTADVRKHRQSGAGRCRGSTPIPEIR